MIAVRHRALDRPGARMGTTWLARVLDPLVTAALAEWIANGGPVAGMPESLRAHIFDPNALGVTPDDELTLVDGAPVLAADLA